MSEHDRIILLDENHMEVDDLSKTVRILAQIGDKWISRQVAPGNLNPMAIAYTPDHEKYERKWGDVPGLAKYVDARSTDSGDTRRMMHSPRDAQGREIAEMNYPISGFRAPVLFEFRLGSLPPMNPAITARRPASKNPGTGQWHIDGPGPPA